MDSKEKIPKDYKRKRNNSGLKEFDVLEYVKYKTQNFKEVWHKREKPEIKRNKS